MTLRNEADQLIAAMAGPAARLRDGQWEAISALVEQRGRVLVVQRTGWGKSAVYFAATRLLRNRGAGPTVLVSPLLALMRNQVEMAKRAGVNAATINSGNRDEWDAIEGDVRDGKIDVLLISPERLNNDRFRADVLPELVSTIGLLVVDEAHCISDWGHDFRPDYRRIARIVDALPTGVPVLCTTATANDRVVDDIVDQLGRDLTVVRGPLARESLELSAIELQSPADRLAWLAQVIPTLEGSGIVYCLTVADSENVASWLRTRGISALAYSGESDIEHRLEVEQRLLGNDVKVVAATSALGMGFDKPDLAFVIHYQSPGSPIAYYQQVGRAGRAIAQAHGVLLRGGEDANIQDYFIRTAFPPREQAETVVGMLAEADGSVSINELQSAVNVRRSRLEAMLKVLEVEDAVERADRGWRRTAKPWAYDEDRVTHVTSLRRMEQQAMVDYARSDDCRMAFLRAQLDDHNPEPCGICDNCTGRPLVVELDTAVVRDAIAFLRGRRFVIEPRKMWPAGMKNPRGKIPSERQLSPGLSLGIAGDGAWGSTAIAARNRGEAYPDELVVAAADALAKLAPEDPPAWVTCVPSAARPGMVEDLARRVADASGLPFHDVVARVRDAPSQREMENSFQQVRNVYGAFAVVAEVPSGPVLLVDDTISSGWTITSVGVTLREAGAGPVVPFVLAKAMGD